MSDSRKVKKIMQLCLWVIAVVFTVSIVTLTVLFISLSSDLKHHRELTTVSQQDIQAYTTDELLSIEMQIEDKLGRIQTVALVMCSFIILDVMLACVFSFILRKRTSSQIYRYAYIDEITGLPTKAKHRQDLERRLNKLDRNLAYVSMEIDNFKYVNDMYGYSYGNYLLKYVANEIGKEILPDELFSRTSGAKFGLLVHYDGDEELRHRLLSIFRKISHLKSNVESDTVYNVLFTCGVYRIKDSDEAAIVRECANIAREASKRLFDNNIEFYDEKMQEKRAEQIQLEYEMRSAFENKQFTVYLQPKYSTENEKIVGAEALVRWEHPQKGMIMPCDFIPLFETNGFIVKIDYYVLECVCGCIRKWLDENVVPVVVSVNLSRVHLYDTELVNRLVEIADRYRVPHHLIEFELTETVLFEELNYLLEVMANLKAAGFILSMDDFGSGYSSLNMLKKLPVDILKLDKGFLENYKEDDSSGKDRTIISHVIAMAKALDMEVLAEGVENESQMNFLLRTDCDMIQGYYFARPMKMEQFDEQLRTMRIQEAAQA